MLTKYLPLDKRLHLLTGYVGGTLLGIVHPLLAVCVITLVGITKECWYDRRYGGCVEWRDALATALGGVAGALVVARGALW